MSQSYVYYMRNELCFNYPETFEIESGLKFDHLSRLLHHSYLYSNKETLEKILSFFDREQLYSILENTRDLDVVKYIFLREPECINAKSVKYSLLSSSLEIVKYVLETLKIYVPDQDVLIHVSRYNSEITKYYIERHNLIPDIKCLESSSQNSKEISKMYVDVFGIVPNETCLVNASGYSLKLVKYYISFGLIPNQECVNESAVTKKLEIVKYYLKEHELRIDMQGIVKGLKSREMLDEYKSQHGF